MSPNIYMDGTYRESHPSWHAEDSPWKARQLLRLIRRNDLHLHRVCEVGCGAGGILANLLKDFPNTTEFEGWDISPDAIGLAKVHETPQLTFHLGDVSAIDTSHYDLLIAADVVEHVEDPFAFVKALHSKATWKIFHIPLDMNVQLVLRGSPIMKSRRENGHLHYFSLETALALLEDTGYFVVDYFYTAPKLDPAVLTGRISHLVRPLRAAAFRVNRNLAVRILGGFSLLVLVK